MLIDLWVGPEAIKVSIAAAEDFHKQLKQIAPGCKAPFMKFAFREPLSLCDTRDFNPCRLDLKTVLVPMVQLDSIIDHVGLQIERSKKPEECKDLLLNMLAIMHGDGGHYVQKHGVRKAVAGAIRNYHDMGRALRDINEGGEAN